jgi:hypothetical protein
MMVQTMRNDICHKVGPGGTAARAVVGTLMLMTVLDGPRIVDGVQAWAWPVALVGFPGALLVLQWLRARRGAPPLRATGPIGHTINVAILVALYGTTWYAPQFSVLSDATVIFYGSSMLLAAIRGYAGCEVLAVSNWLLRRDDQVGCVFFWPVDKLESRLPR